MAKKKMKKKAKKAKVMKKRKVMKKAKKVKAKKVTKKKPAKKAKAPSVRKKLATTAAKKVSGAMMKKAAQANALGHVVHYYDRIGVAVVELNSDLRLGDRIRFQRGPMEFTQEITSLQIDHTPVMAAERGQTVGMKVDQMADKGTLLLPA